MKVQTVKRTHLPFFKKGTNLYSDFKFCFLTFFCSIYFHLKRRMYSLKKNYFLNIIVLLYQVNYSNIKSENHDGW